MGTETLLGLKWGGGGGERGTCDRLTTYPIHGSSNASIVFASYFGDLN